VTLLEHDFRSSITKGASHRGQDITRALQSFGDTEIGKDKFGVGLLCEIEQVFWFEIWGTLSAVMSSELSSVHTSVNNVSFVEIVDSL
jgi:hypothetical protein